LRQMHNPAPLCFKYIDLHAPAIITVQNAITSMA
jgi:hypothetical protein